MSLRTQKAKLYLKTTGYICLTLLTPAVFLTLMCVMFLFAPPIFLILFGQVLSYGFMPFLAALCLQQIFQEKMSPAAKMITGAIIGAGLTLLISFLCPPTIFVGIALLVMVGTSMFLGHLAGEESRRHISNHKEKMAELEASAPMSPPASRPGYQPLLQAANGNPYQSPFPGQGHTLGSAPAPIAGRGARSAESKRATSNRVKGSSYQSTMVEMSRAPQLQTAAPVSEQNNVNVQSVPPSTLQAVSGQNSNARSSSNDGLLSAAPPPRSPSPTFS